MTDRVVCYRTCDRPRYVARTLPHLLAHTSPDTPVVVVVNCSTPQLRDDTLQQVALANRRKLDPRPVHVAVREGRIGGVEALHAGVAEARQRWDGLEHVLVCDDDIYPPIARHAAGAMVHWDDAIVAMLAAGWEVAAIPWAADFHRDETTTHGGVEGHLYDHVGSGCSGFRLDVYDRHRPEQISLVRGLNSWTQRWCTKVGYVASPPMVCAHLDRPEHGHSERDGLYKRHAQDMWWDRFPNRRGSPRPVGEIV